LVGGSGRGDGCQQAAQWRLPAVGGGRPASMGMSVTRGAVAVATRGAAVSAARGAGVAAARGADVAEACGAGVMTARGAGAVRRYRTRGALWGGRRGQLEPGGALGRVRRGRGTGRSRHRGLLAPPPPSDCMSARGRSEWEMLFCVWERLGRTAWPLYCDVGNGRERQEGESRHPSFSPLSRPSGESDRSGVRLTPFLGVLNI